MHKKRGQVSTFIIIGLVVLFVFILIFFLRDQIREKFRAATNTEEYLNSQLNQIKKNAESCIVKETDKATKLLGESGGYFNPTDYVSYYGKRVSILCSNIEGEKKCNAKPLDLEDVNSRLNEYLKSKIKNCINLSPYRNKDYILSAGEFELTADIKSNSIFVEVDYPITLTLENNEAKISKFENKLEIPLGEAVILTNTIISEEASSGTFDVMIVSLLSRGSFTIRERKSYPHKIYIIDFWNGKYIFNFAIEGEK